MATAQKEPESKQLEIKGQGRSASYPWIDLKTAEERAQQFWAAEKTYEAPLSAAFKHWGYGPKSSGARLTVAAMLNYGLMSDRGSNEQRMVKLTPLGVELMMAPNAETKLKALKVAAQKPRVFGDLLKTVDPENPPSDQTIAHQLVMTKGFNPTGAETFIKTFKGTIKHAQLKKSDIMFGVGTPDEGGGSGQGENLTKEVNLLNAGASTTSGTASSAMTQKGFKQDVYHFADGGQVILQWPDGMSRESFAEFTDWIALELRKIGRAVAPPDPKEE